MIDLTIKIIIVNLISVIEIFKRIIGSIFCTVHRRYRVNHGAYLAIRIIQEWMGAAPNFNNKLIKKINDISGSGLKNNFLEILKNSNKELIACTKKYEIINEEIFLEK